MSKLTALCALALAACGAANTGVFMRADNAPVMPARPARSVDMYLGAPPAVPYRDLGKIIIEVDRVAALDHATIEDRWRAFRRAGGLHGCDAIVLEKREHGHSIWTQTADCLQYTATR
jgi:hypothetical protein